MDTNRRREAAVGEEREQSEQRACVTGMAKVTALVSAKAEAMRLVADLHIAIHGGHVERTRARDRVTGRTTVIVEHLDVALA